MAYADGGKIERMNAAVNTSATAVEKAGAKITGAAHKAVMYDTNGDVVIATSGDKAIGLILSDSPDTIEQGRDVNILITDGGLAEAGSAIAKGDLVTVNASGQVIAATSGSFIFGRAFTAAGAAGEIVQIQINQMGVMA